MSTKGWDVFISHASEDKQQIVKPLADFLSSVGAQVWYDEFTLKLGDSLSRSIDKGLADSRFGIVLLSKAFIKKDWPEYELRGLIAKELGREKVILPIWHDIDRNEVLAFSPPLADKLALKTRDLSIEDIGVRVLGIIRPDLLSKIHARTAFEKLLREGKRELVDAKTVRPGPIRHKELPASFTRRTRLIRAALLIPYPQTLSLWLDGFQRDLDPEKEIEFWEHVAACYLEYSAINDLTHDQHKAAFSVILGSIMYGNDAKTDKALGQLPPDSVKLLLNGCKSPLPAYELQGLPKSMDEEIEMEIAKLREEYSPKTD